MPQSRSGSHALHTGNGSPPSCDGPENNATSTSYVAVSVASVITSRRRSDGDEAAVLHERRSSTEPQRVIRIVRRHDHGHPVCRQRPHHPQRQHLIAEIEMRGRLVEQNHVRLLHQDPREQDQLALAAAQPGCRADPSDAACRRARAPASASARSRAPGKPEEAQVRSPAHEHHVADGKGKRRRVVLKQEADSAGAGRRRKAADLVTAHLDRSTARRQRAGDAAQQRRLPTSVRAEHRQDLARDARPDRGHAGSRR